MKNILVVGSASATEIAGRWDRVYCANSSMSRVPHHFDPIVTHVASRIMFIDAELIGKKKGEYAKASRIVHTESLRNRKPARVLIYGSDARYTGLEKVSQEKRYAPREVILVTGPDAHWFVIGQMGLLPLAKAWKSSPGRLRNLVSIFQALFFEGDLRHQLRPSTGVLSILTAISENGENALYTIDGISSTRSHAFYNGKNFTYESKNGHMPFDQIALEYLTARYPIQFIE